MSHQHISDHLSEAVETTIEALESAGCITVDGSDLQGANLGLIAAHYYLRAQTVELFAKSVTAATKRKGLLEILSAASEFDQVPVRIGEEGALRSLANALGLRQEAKTEKLNEPHTKTLLLMYAHFQRVPISTDLAHDQRYILEQVVRLLQGLVDVISSSGWLTPAVLSMEISQMCVQALTANASPLLQLPHFTMALTEKAKGMEVEDIFDLMNQEEARGQLLDGMSDAQMADIAKACNRYPCISMSYKVANEDSLSVGGVARLQVKLERDVVDEGPIGPVIAPFYPKEKDEAWWVVVGHSGQLLALKRVAMGTKTTLNVNLDIELPQEATRMSCTLYFMSDSYSGCDQEYKLDLKVKA